MAPNNENPPPPPQLSSAELPFQTIFMAALMLSMPPALISMPDCPSA
jgi:hypothetical protein